MPGTEEDERTFMEASGIDQLHADVQQLLDLFLSGGDCRKFLSHLPMFVHATSEPVSLQTVAR
eukprot:4568196-Karenia_brevis.AAC.1